MVWMAEGKKISALPTFRRGLGRTQASPQGAGLRVGFRKAFGTVMPGTQRSHVCKRVLLLFPGVM